jgi:AcrR family transcriptional regulator
MPRQRPATATSADHVAERRGELLAATARVIARRGYAGTRFQDVAAEAGVAVGTLQHHFGTRARMLSEAMDQWVDEIDAQLLVLRTRDADPWTRLEGILVYAGTRIGERNEAWRMWLDFAGAALKDAELSRSGARSQQRWEDAFADLIREGIDAEAFDPGLPAEDAASILSALLDGLGLQVFALESDISGEEATRRLVGAARSMLRPRAA